MQGLSDEGMAKRVDTIARRTFTKERQPQEMSELLPNQCSQPIQQDHALNYSQPTQGQSRETAGTRTSRFQTRL